MIEYFAKNYYTVPIQIILNLIFIIASVINFRKLTTLKILLPYAILSLLQSIIGVYLNSYVPYSLKVEKILESTINIFMLMEFILFYAYIISIFKNRQKVRRVLIVVLIIYTIAIFWNWYFTDSFRQAPSSFTIIESYLIIIACLFYYLDLFQNSIPIPMSDNPQFWTITGMLLLFAFLTPLTLQLDNVYTNFLPIYNPLYSLNFVGYSLLFIFLIISLRCQIKIMT